MRKMLCVLLVLVLLAGCAAPAQKPAVPMAFYYTRKTPVYHAQEGTMAQELRDLGQEELPIKEIVELYLQGPLDSTLASPFAKGSACDEAVLDGGVLLLRMNDAYAARRGVDATVAAACLTMTLTQIPSVREVCIETDNGVAAAPIRLAKDDFLLQDLSAQNPEITATLYFEHAVTGELRAEKRAVAYTGRSELPKLLLQELFSGPTISGLQNPIPSDTQCMDLSVSDDGVCTVILSVAFAECDRNRESAERAVYAIVATLCTLDEIGSVRLMLEDGGNLKNFSISDNLQPQNAWF